MMILLWGSVTITCIGVGGIGLGVLFMNMHHKRKELLASPKKAQISSVRRESSQRVVSSRLSSPPVRKNYQGPRIPDNRRSYHYEEEEIRIPPSRPRSKAQKNVVRECSLWVLLIWWLTTLFCWFTLILQAVVEVIK